MFTRNARRAMNLSLHCSVLALATLLSQSASAQLYRVTPTPTQEDILTAPLPRTDPRAQLTPEQANTPPEPMPKASAQPRRSQRLKDLSVIIHDLQTRQTYRESYSDQENMIRNWWDKNDRQESGSSEFRGYATEGVGNERGLGIRPMYVMGSDNRVRITPTTAFPWSTVCKIYVTFPNGVQTSGTGTMVGAKHVLTAGHVVYNSSRGGYASSVTVVPAQDGNYKPYGEAYATRFRVFAGWTSDGDHDDDMALVTVNRSIGFSSGWLSFGYLSFENQLGNNLGYPGEKQPGPGKGLYYNNGTLERAGFWPFYNDYQIDISNIDVTPGHSGGPIYLFRNGVRYIVGVASYEWTIGITKGNRASRVSSGKNTRLREWIATGN